MAIVKPRVTLRCIDGLWLATIRYTLQGGIERAYTGSGISVDEAVRSVYAMYTHSSALRCAYARLGLEAFDNLAAAFIEIAPEALR